MSGIFDEIADAENLFAAWREFRGGKRGRADVQAFECRLEDNVFALAEDLKSDRYRHGAYRRFLVFDPKLRVIHKATVRDRLVHHATHRSLLRVFERSFIQDSYSCRVGKGTHAAVRRLEIFARKVSKNYRGPCWALKFDIRRFFDSVDHAILFDCLRKRIECPRTLKLLADIVGSHSSTESRRGGGVLSGTRRPTGLPIGNLTSQLFANIYLDAFDHFVKEKLGAYYYIRYTDDAIILHHDPAILKSFITSIAAWLLLKRRLTLHPRKTEIRKLSQGIDFLGYVALPYHQVLRTKTKRRMMKRIHAKNISSYMGILEHCDGYRLRQAVASKRSLDCARDDKKEDGPIKI